MARQKFTLIVQATPLKKMISLEYRMEGYPLSIPVVRSGADHSDNWKTVLHLCFPFFLVRIFFPYFFSLNSLPLIMICFYALVVNPAELTSWATGYDYLNDEIFKIAV